MLRNNHLNHFHFLIISINICWYQVALSASTTFYHNTRKWLIRFAIRLLKPLRSYLDTMCTISIWYQTTPWSICKQIPSGELNSIWTFHFSIDKADVLTVCWLISLSQKMCYLQTSSVSGKPSIVVVLIALKVAFYERG